MIRKISFRLGMEGGLYLGICLGALFAAVMTVSMILLLSPTEGTVLAIQAALILAALIAAAIVIILQNTRRNAQDEFCTCRYRSSLYVRCRECALKEPRAGPADRPEQAGK